jgi:hypothetical protein
VDGNGVWVGGDATAFHRRPIRWVLLRARGGQCGAAAGESKRTACACLRVALISGMIAGNAEVRLMRTCCPDTKMLPAEIAEALPKG